MTDHAANLAAALRPALQSLTYAADALDAPERCAMREDLARAVAALAAYDAAQAQQDSPDDLSAAALLVHAYARGEARGGTDWDDLGRAWERACIELGPDRVAEIATCYDLE